MKCIADAWERHEAELRRFLRHRTSDNAAAEDLLQEVFLRALRQQNGLCGIDNPRAWLFHAARNLIIDRLRLTKDQIPLPDDLAAEIEEMAPAVDGLVQCLPRVLAELSPQDREAIMLCDIGGMTQHDFATRIGLTLPAAKSRVQRARKHLKSHMSVACQVKYDEAGKVEGFVKRSPL